MAEIEGFKGWRYNTGNELIKNIAINPDKNYPSQIPQVLNDKTDLSKSSFRAYWEVLKHEKFIIQDTEPGIYICKQTFGDFDNKQKVTRNSFICLVKLPSSNSNHIMMHENVIDRYVQEKLDFLTLNKIEESPLLGLYQDEAHIVETAIEDARKKLVYEFKDLEGTFTQLYNCTESSAIKIIKDFLVDQKIILADGHHRYNAALTAKDVFKGSHYQNASEYAMIMLTNMEAPGLTIKPIHRGISNLEGFDQEEVITKLQNFFNLRTFDHAEGLYHELKTKNKAFGLMFPKNLYLAELKDGLEKNIPWNFPEKIKSLSYTILHYYILEKGFGIEGKEQKNSKKIKYITIFDECRRFLETNDCQAVVLANPVTKNELKEVVESGYILPQKSTNFFPKALDRLVNRDWEN
ncbi:DUF1015 family protein [Cytophagaceae bacterium ABcell3]|nr:DUF1015 family protein [Cytophagaceae bacterium ABcell3]